MRPILFLVVAILAAACSPNPERDLIREYAATTRGVGIFPLYPPREDFQIGDVLMYSSSVTDSNDSVSVHVTSMDWLRQEADRFMGSRIVFENTPDPAGPASATDIPAGRSGLALRREIGGNDLGRSLPIVGFPSVTADAGFTAGVGLVDILYAVGLGGGSRTTVTLNFNDVRTYWVPPALVRARIDRELGPAMATYGDAALADLTRQVRARRGGSVEACGNGRVCGVVVVTRVYLTRKITYTYRNAQILAAAMRHAGSRDGATVSQSPVAPAPAVNVNVVTGSDATIDGTSTLAALRTQVDALGAGNSQGQGFRLEAWDARGVSFANTFQRPVAIGWDGVEFQF